MPYFAVIGRDAEGMSALRSRVRESHRHYLRHHGRRDVIVRLGGPTLSADRSGMNGTLLVVEAPCEAEVHALLDDDPYVQNGIFASVLVLRWQWSLGSEGHSGPTPRSIDPAP